MGTSQTIAAKDEIHSLVQEVLPDIIDIRRELHSNPELAYEETETARRVREFHDSRNIQYRDKVGVTGVLGWIDGKNAVENGTVVGIRADMDALPIQEQTGKPYASKVPGRMHACGHDGHTAILLGTAHVLNKLKDKIPGSVVLFHQPAEEGGCGARKMIEEKALEDPKHVDWMFALHGHPYMKVGQVGLRNGPVMAAMDEFTIRVIGKAGHAAEPQTGIDPVPVAAEITLALQKLITRGRNPRIPAVLTVAQIHAGSAFNIIPGEAYLNGTLRTLDENDRSELKKGIQRTAENIAKAGGMVDCKVDLHEERGTPVNSNNKAAIEYVKTSVETVLGKDALQMMEEPLMASEDFAFFQQQRPGAYFFLGIADPKTGKWPFVHQPQFDFNEEAIPIGMELMVHSVLNAMQK